ncbi:MAG TPA: DUF302 domain-containing protein [Sulfuricurvum sp.]|uniref:DUF302 domain-containing protein n=1 Tax=Sulfuricurvum sp. TaxID=2025608 RepID=UPI000BC8507A|nr:DUF302 domain-containing protein [Sulfuricurvum sp.]OYZ32692.1 MAG: hypothetical protein B7Y30_10685 [Campylobacterales bacterium 16-40-21]OZA02148.1 MAG: hypothetical protein B7X89_10660 [Sulfuricurvum sp. 17-40-25]MDD5160767.1 DUF302 domain-containing protein [Sulfuricurvum sp.]HQS67686.1 DUF302 domain-containing protein [Sulfuricurvum sp.]HQT36934.1 DUF302 domain-containing protein [Sulfuricurvum sp.]
MLYTITSQESIAIIKEEMGSKAKEVGFGILKEYSFKEILQEKGYPIERDIFVFELCNPVAAQAALKTHPEVSVYLPCRISLYERDGATVLSTIGIDEILDSFDLDSEFKSHMKNIFSNLKKLLGSWK